MLRDLKITIVVVATDERLPIALIDLTAEQQAIRGVLCRLSVWCHAAVVVFRGGELVELLEHHVGTCMPVCVHVIVVVILDLNPQILHVFACFLTPQ